MDGATVFMPVVFSVLGSVQLTWFVNKDGRHLCCLLSNFRPYQAACLSQKIALDEY